MAVKKRRRQQYSSAQGNFETLEKTLEYVFSTKNFLYQALTHRSHIFRSNEANSHYERLEFLGDSILGFLVSDFLTKHFLDFSEGQLTKMRAFLVRTENLASVARRLNLGNHLILGASEESGGGRDKTNLLADALEAMIAAIYLDGGIQEARDFVKRVILDTDALTAAEQNLPLDNFKSALQELLQARKLPAPDYKVLKEDGPQHQKTFCIQVNIGNFICEQASGYSKKSAEQEAARLALSRVREITSL